MQKNLINVILAGFLFLLAGCQTNTLGTTNLFSPFPPAMPLSQTVQDALMRSGDPVVAQVRVETMQNTVILSGYVKKIRQSDVAEQITRQVPGVQNVQNNIIVRQ